MEVAGFVGDRLLQPDTLTLLVCFYPAQCVIADINDSCWAVLLSHPFFLSPTSPSPPSLTGQKHVLYAANPPPPLCTHQHTHETLSTQWTLKIHWIMLMKDPAEFVCLPQASLAAICLPHCGALLCYAPLPTFPLYHTHTLHPLTVLLSVWMCLCWCICDSLMKQHLLFKTANEQLYIVCLSLIHAVVFVRALRRCGSRDSSFDFFLVILSHFQYLKNLHVSVAAKWQVSFLHPCKANWLCAH